MKEKRLASIFAGIAVFFVAALAGVSLVSAIFAPAAAGASLSRVGAALFSAYGFTSFLIPCFFLASSIFLLIPGWSPRAVLTLGFSFVPFLTIAGGERLIKTLSMTVGNPGTSRVVSLGLVVSTALAVSVEYLLFLSGVERFVSARFDSSARGVPRDSGSAESFAAVPLDFSDETSNEEYPDEIDAASDIAQGDPVLEAPLVADFPDEIPEPDFHDPFDSDASGVIPEDRAETPLPPVTEPIFTDAADDSSAEPVDESLSAGTLVSIADSQRETQRIAPVEASYIDIEKMRAPFDLPVIEEWVEPEPQVSAAGIPSVSPDDSSEPVAEDPEPDEEFDAREPVTDASPGVAAFDPPAFDGRLGADEDLAEDEDGDVEDESDSDYFESEDEIGENAGDDIEDDLDPDNLAVEDFPVDEGIPAIDEDFTGDPMDFDVSEEIESVSPELRAATDSTDLPPVLSVPPAPPSDEEASTPEQTPAPRKLFAKRPRMTYAVPYDILTAYPDGEYWLVDDATRHAAAALKDTLNEFRIEADVTGIRKGPVITMFEILPAPGVKLSRIVGLQDNIALRLAASSVRIVAPIPGKHAVGIEVPNQRRSIVSFRELIESDTPVAKKMEIPVVLGKDITGEAQLLDLAATPHLLIAGSTGSGKSVCVNSIILSILYKRSPEDVKLILIDPKIVELKLYNDIGHLLSPVITEPKKAFQALQYCLCEMERRYAVLDGMGVRDIKSYNRRIKERNIAAEKLPYVVIIIDEFADLMATTGKELESTVARLCAMSRAVGIHLVLATQRPSIDVITGLIKANIPTRIAFMVASKMDSRIIIDQVGAEKLLGRGDMLYASAVDPFPVRIQGAFVSEEEVERVVEHVKTLGEPEYIDEEMFVEDEEDGELDQSLFSDGEDPLYDKALEIVMLAGKASASYIQRKLKIGYNRAARLVEDMEARGIVGPANGSKPREVIHHI